MLNNCGVRNSSYGVRRCLARLDAETSAGTRDAGRGDGENLSSMKLLLARLHGWREPSCDAFRIV